MANHSEIAPTTRREIRDDCLDKAILVAGIDGKTMNIVKNASEYEKYVLEGQETGE